MNVEERVLGVVWEVTGVLVSPRSKIREIVRDSLEFLELLMTVGNEFGTNIDKTKYKEIVTVQDVIDSVKSSIEAAQ